MTKISMAQAAKIFAVSRPTLLKHLQQGKITGEKTKKDKHEFWQIDVSELARVYPRRDAPAPVQHDGLTNTGSQAAPDLQAEINLLQAKLKAAEAMAEERGRHIEDLRGLLSAPDKHPQNAGARRGWWPFRRG